MRWRKRTLGEVVRFQRGYDLPEQAREPGTVPVIGSAGQNGWHNEARAKGPGVSIGRSGASIGKVTYTPVDYWPHNACLYVTDFFGNDPRFVYYFLQTQDLTLLNSGAAQPSLNRNFVHTLPVRVPRPNEQVAIASFLSAYADLIENNRQRIAMLEEATRLLYREWFVHFRFPGHELVKFTDGLPNGWNPVNLGEIAVIRKGKNITKSMAEEGDVPVVAGGLKPAYHHSMSNALSPVVTVSASGANAGNVVLYQTDIWASDCSYISASENAQIWFLYLAMKSRQTEITGMQQGAAQPHVYPKHLERLRLVFPPANLLKLFHESVDASFRQIATLEKANRKLAEARDLLLPRLMNGQITV